MRAAVSRIGLVVLCLVMFGCGIPSSEKQVLIASKPTGATVKLEGAEIGYTPVNLTVQGNTTIVVEKKGYETQEVEITGKSGPNLVVELTQIPVETKAATGYTTMRQIKEAYRDGTISRVQYDQNKSRIRARRAQELERAQRDYRTGRLTEGRYKQRVREIKLKYEG